ncbi:MAG: hypothetical protein ACM3SU_01075 [Acidobacteriota bacterium]
MAVHGRQPLLGHLLLARVALALIATDAVLHIALAAGAAVYAWPRRARGDEATSSS